MKRIAIVLLIFCLNMAALGQTRDNREVDIIDHQVKQGETVRLISKKYLVTPADIYKLNKFAVDGISQGMVLQIPVRKKANSSTPASNPSNGELTTEIEEVEAIQNALAAEGDQQEVAANKQATSAPGELEENNPQTETDAPITNSTVEHKVLPGETLSALSKKYGTTVDAIKRENSKLLNHGLQTGQIIKISAGNPIPVASPEKTIENEGANPTKDTDAEMVEHKVEAKETLFSISRRYNITVDEIKQQNPVLLAHGLQTGQVIKIKLKK